MTTASCERCRWLPPVATFALLAVLTLGAWQWQVRTQAEHEARAEQQEIAAVAAQIRERLNLHGQFLRALQAFATSVPSQDAAAWQHFARILDAEGSPAGMFAFAYAPLQAPGDAGKFQISPKLPVDREIGKTDDNPPRRLSLPLLFVAPAKPSLETVIGFDLASEAVRRDAIERAMRSGKIAMTGPIELQIDKGLKRPAFEMFHAIQTEGQVTGVVLTAYRVDEFMAAIKLPANSQLSLQVFDTTADKPPAQAAPIFSSQPQPAPEATAVQALPIEFGGRIWSLQFYRAAQVNSSLDTASLVLYSGLLGSLLLSLLIYHLANHRERAESYARKLTQELSEHRDRLQEAVHERTESLNNALKEAYAAGQAKAEFLTNMSHELRTPIHAILSFVELGYSRLSDAGDAKVRQYFQRIDQSGQRLLALINDLLDLSKLDAGRMECHPSRFDVQQLLGQVGAQLESLLVERQLQLVIDCQTEQTQIVADPTQIAQVVCNLLSNAIKFSPEGGTIRVVISADQLPTGRRADDRGIQAALSLRFIDQGIGIPPDELESIFDKFVQSSATRNGAGGTGLGLTISRAIVSQHRGRIVALNNPDQGASFIVTLPLNSGMEPSEAHD